MKKNGFKAQRHHYNPVPLGPIHPNLYQISNTMVKKNVIGCENLAMYYRPPSTFWSAVSTAFNFSRVLTLFDSSYFAHPSLMSAAAEFGIEPDLDHLSQ